VVRLAAESEASHLVRTFATTTAGLIELGEWLEENGCTHVEATGVYWKRCGKGFELVQAQINKVSMTMTYTSQAWIQAWMRRVSLWLPFKA
jgi:hypothetical protein